MDVGVAFIVAGLVFISVGCALIGNVRGLGARVGHVAGVWGALFGDRSGLRNERRISLLYGVILSVIGVAFVVAGVTKL